MTVNTLLVLNSGSSSLKFQLFTDDAEQTLLARGMVSAIGTAPVFKISGEDRTETLPSPGTHEDALNVILKWIDAQPQGWTLTSAGHRVVHGGNDFSRPTVVTPDVIEQLLALVPLAPLHQPHNVASMKVLAKLRPDLPQVACFDTAFHATNPPLFTTFPLPAKLRDKGVRRYGFHGLSYEWVAGMLREEHPQLAKGRVVVAHLGAGASLCAMQDGKGVNTTMSLTALDGLTMGTRCGAIDPGVLLYLLRTEKMTPDEVEHLLYFESGLKGLSGISSEVKALLDSDDPRAKFAIEHFTLRVAQFISMMVVSLGGVDGLVFTGGIGENSQAIRDMVMSRLGFLNGLTPLVIPTNEERVIARHVRQCLAAQSKAA